MFFFIEKKQKISLAGALERVGTADFARAHPPYS
jgi:hypothetical protein